LSREKLTREIARLTGELAEQRKMRAVAQCLSSQLKRPSDLAARHGGEEFVALLPDTDEAGAPQVAETIRAAVESLQIGHRRSSVSSYVTLRARAKM
jgi:diguanylate cyclase (GGDEF)-like protein